MSARIDRVQTNGIFSLDGGTWDVENNVWIIGDDDSAIVIDPAHDTPAILAALGQRKVHRILLTHGHDDHIRNVREFAGATGAPVYLHPADNMLWDAVYPGTAPDAELADGDTFSIAGSKLLALHTPGHSPGSVSFYSADVGTVLTGDTLFNGGPGATGRSYSSLPQILESITKRLMILPPETVVRTGHGDSTTIGAERTNLPAE